MGSDKNANNNDLGKLVEKMQKIDGELTIFTITFNRYFVRSYSCNSRIA